MAKLVANKTARAVIAAAGATGAERPRSAENLEKVLGVANTTLDHTAALLKSHGLALPARQSKLSDRDDPTAAAAAAKDLQNPAAAAADPGAPAKPAAGVAPQDAPIWEAKGLSDEAKRALLQTRADITSAKVEKETHVAGYLDSTTWVQFADLFYIALAFLMPVLVLAALHERSTSFESTTNRNIIYVADIVLQGFTLWWLYRNCIVQTKRGDWEVNVERDRIRHEYVHSPRFAFDLLYAVPIEWLFIGWHFEIFKWLQVRQGLRLFRMLDITHSQNPLLHRRAALHFASVFAMAAFLACALAAIFWQQELGYDFVDSMYWMGATTSSTGYGDITATQDRTKIYSIFVMLFGLVTLALLSGWAASALTQSDRLQKHMDDDKELLHSMLEFYHVPWNIRRELIALFPTVLELEQAEDFRRMLENLPSVVTRKIEAFANAKYLRGLDLFKDLVAGIGTEDASGAHGVVVDPAVLRLHQEVIMQVASKLSRQYVPSKDIVVLGGLVGKEVYFLVRGVAELTSYTFKNAGGAVVDGKSPDVTSCEERIHGVLRSGAHFGVEALVGKPAPYSVEARSVLEVAALKVEDIDALAAVFPAQVGAIRAKLVEAVADFDKLRFESFESVGP